MAFENEYLFDAMKINRTKRSIDNLKIRVGGAHADDEAIEAGLSIVKDACNAQMALFWFYDRFGDEKICAQKVLGAQQEITMALDFGEGVPGGTIEKQKPLLVTDCRRDLKWAGRADQRLALPADSMIAVPLVIGTIGFGCIQLVNKLHDTGFDRDDLELAQRLAVEFGTLLESREFLRPFVVYAGRAVEDTTGFEAVFCAPTKAEMNRLVRRTNCFQYLERSEKAKVLAAASEMYDCFEAALNRYEYGDTQANRGFSLFARRKK